jgi:16S rRNA (adenine1518-N6/adenine1519-N6)-dimethyltransferase
MTSERAGHWNVSVGRVRAKKKYGQHFLEAAWADKVIAAIDPRPDDRFVEIGPGPGALTLRLAPRVAWLTAIELDADMIAVLESRVPANVTVVHADFLEIGMDRFANDRPFRIAGNLPYSVSSPILFAIIDAHRTLGGIVDATLMVQREVADRIVASPGTRDYGVLSILVQLHSDAARVLALPAGAFRPAPTVRSAVVNLRFRRPAVRLADEPLFESMVRTMFTQRRKMLSNALEPFAAARGQDTGAALARAEIDPRRRPETLQLTELARLADYFASV